MKVFCIDTTRQLNDDECDQSSKLLGEYFILSGVYSGVHFKKNASPYMYLTCSRPTVVPPV